ITSAGEMGGLGVLGGMPQFMGFAPNGEGDRLRQRMPQKGRGLAGTVRRHVDRRVVRCAAPGAACFSPLPSSISRLHCTRAGCARALESTLAACERLYLGGR